MDGLELGFLLIGIVLILVVWYARALSICEVTKIWLVISQFLTGLVLVLMAVWWWGENGGGDFFLLLIILALLAIVAFFAAWKLYIKRQYKEANLVSSVPLVVLLCGIFFMAGAYIGLT